MAAGMAKTIFITGAGSGIGRAAAERFAAEGWRVAAADLNPQALDALRAAIGPGHLCLALDVGDAGAVQAAMAKAAGGNGGRIDMLLNSAGVGTLADFEATPLEKLHATVDVNVKGVINCTHAAFPYLKAAGGAKVVNMGSLASEYGVPSEAVYSASKFFVRGLTEAMNIEWERHGIHVSDVMPNFVRTPMMQGVSGKLVESVGIHLTAEDVVRAIWKAASDRRRIHWVVDTPKSAILRAVGKLLPSLWRRRIYKDLCGY
jgi:NAD(P)-dependent dehydrogenase (short-subunit alcohol dehydrogenase family)